MLTIAVLSDIAGIVCVFLTPAAGAGVFFGLILDWIVAPIFAAWAATRPFYRAVIGGVAAKAGQIGIRAASYGMEKISSVGGESEQSPVQASMDQLGSKAAKAANAGLKGANLGFTGIKIGLSAIKFIITFILEQIPILEGLPFYTLFVLSEMAQSEMEI